MRLLLQTWDRLVAWGDVAAFYVRGREVRRIDVVMAVGFVACVTYYWVMSGWQGALIGGLMYVLFAMVALWLL
jgi:hypothetical protein